MNLAYQKVATIPKKISETRSGPTNVFTCYFNRPSKPSNLIIVYLLRWILSGSMLFKELFTLRDE